ncbi:unnamed protein product [Rotaria sordida]|uniref:Uncharacterized protein n=1 Tax=Rotaria sordida TaxID=392033 RepID=A0A820B5D2_9BILA|nr:unnamed protein product [Rotaria sordida]
MDKFRKSCELLKITASEDILFMYLKQANLTRIQVKLHGIIKHNPDVGSKAFPDKMNDKLYSTSTINNEKQTSAAKLVNQLYFL